MLTNLSNQISSFINNIKNKNKITDENISNFIEKIKKSFIEADVNIEVTENFINEIKNKIFKEEIKKLSNPLDHIIQIIYNDLVNIFTNNKNNFSKNNELSKNLYKIILVGLNGVGKTTSSVKLAKILQDKGKNCLLVACDFNRPASYDQLKKLSNLYKLPVYQNVNNKHLYLFIEEALKEANKMNIDTIIFDYAGILPNNKNSLLELEKINSIIKANDIYFVSDINVGQEATSIIQNFNNAINITGIIITKCDSDSPGGSVLSITKITGIPIKYISNGEKIHQFEVFYPDRMAKRILGMGDILSLIEKTEKTFSDNKVKEKIVKNLNDKKFNLDDLLNSLKSLKKIGSLSYIMSMLPNMNGLSIGDKEEKWIKKIENIISSMNFYERNNPDLISNKRKLKIAYGSGTSLEDVNKLLQEFNMMKKLLKNFDFKNTNFNYKNIFNLFKN